MPLAPHQPTRDTPTAPSSSRSATEDGVTSFSSSISCLAAFDGTNALGFYARRPKLAIANEFDTNANGPRALYAPARAITARMEGLSRHSPGRDLRRFAAGPSL